MLLPLENFAPSSQEPWLPALLVIMVIIADVELIARRSPAMWPWLLMAFDQGFNVISRMMIIWSHATVMTGSGPVPNWTYIILAVISMALSAFLLTYSERPDVRVGLLRQRGSTAR